MPFCPQCREEYSDGVTTCEDCGGAALVASLDVDAAYESVEIYSCADAMEAQAIRDELLGANGIDAQIHDFTSQTFPAPASQGERRISVSAAQSAEAIELIRAARNEGIISSQGAFLAEVA